MNYPTEPNTFHRASISQNRTTSFSQDAEIWHNNNNNINNNNNNVNNILNTPNTPDTNPVSCDLQEVIMYYQSQPDLLRLILMSKVEEDKRRAEEAKLRAKELDLLFNLHSLGPKNQLLNVTQFNQEPRRHSALEMLIDESDCNRRDSALGSSFDGSANSDEAEEFNNSTNNTTNNANSMFSMSFPPQPMTSMAAPRNSLHPLSPPYTISPSLDDSPFSSQIKQEDQSAQSTERRYDSYFPQRPRRRREMQAITKIVETREYPYVDGFFWKNNGNTIQKKTGNKSVYYKCSNSSKGCPVNKTVTWKDNGEYLIKYRGEHLSECGKVQRIVDM
ncbi:hypothetical protein K501DRAFT_240197 [Backusella circina FSU 941]|nr:hypothetical protein K501DRAFT_240197 [Backusella circina FSU 941]